MGNPTHCVVCEAELKRELGSSPVEDPDAAEEGHFQSWDETQLVVQIYCPRCGLLYHVFDPRDLS